MKLVRFGEKNNEKPGLIDPEGGMRDLSDYFSRYAQSNKTWKYINLFIIVFMTALTIYIVKETIYLL